MRSSPPCRVLVSHEADQSLHVLRDRRSARSRLKAPEQPPARPRCQRTIVSGRTTNKARQLANAKAKRVAETEDLRWEYDLRLGPGVADPPPAISDFGQSRSRHGREESYAVRAKPVLGGLHHEYYLAPAAA